MKKRIESSAANDAADAEALENPKFTGDLCGVCGSPQFLTPGGTTCENGHGGAPTAEETKSAFGPEVTVRVGRRTLIAASEDMSNARPVNANAPKEEPLSPPFQRIVEKIFIHDVEATYDRLEEALRVGEQRSDFGTMQRALDEAESNFRDAHRLMVTAKIERDRFEARNDVVFGALRDKAVHSLQSEKANQPAGERKKVITEADVEARCASAFPDEWEHQKIERRKVEMMVRSMENLVQAWDSRCQTLRVLLGKQR